MKKKVIWLIAGGIFQEIVAYKIKKLGYKLIVTDGDSGCVCKKYADYFYELDTFDVNAHLSLLSSFHKDINISAVLTVAADCHLTVNKVAAALGLHHLDPTISEICNNKFLTRERLFIEGMLQPKFNKVESYNDLINLIPDIQYDYVMKAVDSSGSRGFFDFKKGEKPSIDQFNHSIESGRKDYVVIEEKLVSGNNQVSEASVETIWQDGQMYWLNWVDRIFPRDLKFYPELDATYRNDLKSSIEIGHVNPAQRDKYTKDEVYELMWRAGKAIGMCSQKGANVLKGDIFFSNKGAIILELTPRTSGGWDSCGSSVERGADISEGIIYMALGNIVDLDAWMKYFSYKYDMISVFLTKIESDAEDCIGREFFHAISEKGATYTIEKAINEVNNGRKYVSILQ